MTAGPAQPQSPLGRLVLADPPSTRELAAMAWHRQGIVAFPVAVLDELPPAHRAAVMSLAARCYGARVAATGGRA